MNAGMTKVMQCQVSRVQSEDSRKHPCGVCRKRVVSNSVLGVVSRVGFYKADDRRCLTEAKLTEARFTEASSGISCARFERWCTQN